MGVSLLPLEKIPLFIWSIPLMAIGGYLMVNEEPYSFAQFRAAALFLVGAAAFVYDIVVRSRRRHAAERDRNET